MKSDFDVLHSSIQEPDRLFPLNLTQSYQIWNVHDLAYEIMPEVTVLPSPYLSWVRRIRKDTMSKADKLIVLSQAIKSDLVSYFGFHESKISVIPVGTSPYYNTDPKLNFIKEKFGVSEYITCISTIEPRKNYETLLRAFSLIQPRKERLVIVGRMGWKSEHIPRLVKSLGIADRVIFTGYAPLSSLPSIIYHARLFVYPTLYEGWGALLLDAMASGVPVISSKIPVNLETAEKAALLVEPKDAIALADAIREGLDNQQLRQQLVELGMARAKSFQWRDSIDKLTRLYDAANH